MNFLRLVAEAGNEISGIDDLRRQHATVDQTGGGQQCRAADNIPEFPEIAGPGIVKKDLHYVRLKSLDILVKLFVGFGEEEFSKQRYVFFTMANGGQNDR